MIFKSELENKKINRAIKDLNYELTKDVKNINTKSCIATVSLMAGFTASCALSKYTEIAQPLMFAFIIGSIVAGSFYDPKYTRQTKQSMYNIFKVCGAVNANTNKEAVCDVLDKYASNYKSLLENKDNLNKKDLKKEKQALMNEYVRRIELISNDERSEEMFN